MMKSLNSDNVSANQIFIPGLNIEYYFFSFRSINISVLVYGEKDISNSFIILSYKIVTLTVLELYSSTPARYTRFLSYTTVIRVLLVIL